MTSGLHSATMGTTVDQSGNLVEDSLVYCVPPLYTLCERSKRDGVDYTPKFWIPILEGESDERMEGIEEIVAQLKSSLNTDKALFNTHATTVVRLAAESPFEDIRNRMQELIDFAVELGVPPLPQRPAPSSFVPSAKIFSVTDASEEEIQALMEDIFLQSGRVSTLDRMIAWHPEYMRVFCISYDFILNQEGPLPRSWRTYLGILAATTHNCVYLINKMESEFIVNDGEPEWLLGVEHAPPKLRNILKLNEYLAHKPWLIRPEHIASLVKGEDCWSLTELVHAICLLSTMHSLCGLVYGMGVNLEVDMSGADGNCAQLPIWSSSSPKSMNADHLSDTGEQKPTKDQELNTITLVELLRSSESSSESEIEEEPDEIRHLFEHAADGTTTPDESNHTNTTNDPVRYRSDFVLTYEDFDVKSPDYTIFRVQDYCWKDHGYALVSRFYPEAASMLDKCFTTIFYMTDHSVGGAEEVDTFPFRRAIWYYVHRILGMCHDDYNYREVNQFLNRNVKQFSKKVACYPESLTANDYINVGYAVLHREKCHITLLSVEARRQASLLYALHSLMRHIND
eukprot:GFYU01005450.1.p1 GENE.GFYU01005450.1~~GFYU01005450.1.p1  ORF type:complete len:569 (+),score=132.65 GFYU01005450.1:160-1866(+)